MWWKRTLELKGAVFFRGQLAPTVDSFSSLSTAGVEITVKAPPADALWEAELRHPQWGSAKLTAPRERRPLPEGLVEFGAFLTPEERKLLAAQAERALLLQLPTGDGDVLRDRKRLLRFMAALLRGGGVAALDVAAQSIWTPARLADELQHDAPLDIVQVHALHVVSDDAGTWLHSHGLAEMGFLDFDVLRPAERIVEEEFDVLRAIAFAIVEGDAPKQIEPVLGAGPIALVDAQTFMKSASAADRKLRDPDGHSERRVVCCDAKAPGFLARLFGAGEVRPSRLLEQGMTVGRHLVRFSSEATDLCALRARDSLALFEAFGEEFRDLQCTPLVKMGYATDSGRGSDDREHLWFEVHGVKGDRIDATLLNAPFDIASLREGQRSEHPIERLSDWALMTPLGQLTPRSLEVARRLRELRPEILKALAAQPDPD